MPQFTPWNVPSPAPNVLYNPAAVDQAIAQSQSLLGNLDINRQELGLKQAEFARDKAFGEGLTKAIGDLTTTPASATSGGGGSGDSTTETADDLTRAAAVRDGLIQRGMQPEGATAFAANALHESKANPFTGAGDAGASHGIFQWNGDRLAAFRAANGGLLPEQTSLDKQLDFVVSELHGPESTALGRIMGAQGVDGKAGQVSEAYLRPKDTVPEMQRRSATALRLARAWGGQGAPAAPAAPPPQYNPAAGPRIANLPTPAPPGSDAAWLDNQARTYPGLAGPGGMPPVAPGQADATPSAITPAVRQAAATLLAMPEAEAAVAYGPMVKELQSRGEAMQAPAEYPGHAAVQALAEGGAPAPIAPSQTALRTGGTDVAGPGAGPARPDVILDASGKPLLAPPYVEPAPNKLMYGTGIPGVQIGLPASPLAPSPATGAPPGTAPAAAPPPPASRAPVVQPPPAASRTIQMAPTIQSGVFAGLTREQAANIAQSAAAGARPAAVMAQIAQQREHNDTLRQQAATAAAVEANENYNRQHQAQLEAETRAQRELDNRRNAAADARAEQAAKNAGLPPGYRLDDQGVATRINGLPPDPQIAEAAKADYEARQRKLPFQGNAQDAQDRNILITGDPKSPEYHSAYASLSDPKTAEGGLIIKRNMQPYRMPQDADGNPITTYDQPNISIGPGDITKLRDFETGAATLKSALDEFAKTSRGASTGEWAATVAGQPTDLSAAWTNAALMAKGTALYELGVLSGPDMSVLRGALADPSTFRGSLTSNATIDKQVARIKALIDTRLDQARRSYGGGMSLGPTASAAPPPPNPPPDRAAREVGKTYQTPMGALKWTGKTGEEWATP